MLSEKEILRKHDISASLQRILIYRYLLAQKMHPSADEVYAALLPEIPTLSKTTVYNTLNLFAEKGLVTRLRLHDQEQRFDAVQDVHPHLVCVRCNKIVDLAADGWDFSPAIPEGWQIQNKYLFLTGLCPECQKQEETNS